MTLESMTRDIVFRPIGVVHSPFKEPKGVPIQPRAGKDVRGTVEVFPEFAPGLKDLEGFSHIMLLYNFHLSEGYELEVVPYLDTVMRGVFATRAPRRPNAIGLSVVRLLEVEKNVLHIADLDIVDGTPLLDIKPHVREFGPDEEIRIGWLTDVVKDAGGKRADGRFLESDSL
jgi:tRNA-Thr(GGU) m(6)t(6)A37 methyltransferase TsaA